MSIEPRKGGAILLGALFALLLLPFSVRAGELRGLAKTLKGDQSEFKRAEAATRMGELREEGVCQSLISAARDPSSVVRTAVARALGKAVFCQALAPLRELAREDHPKVKSSAEESLRALGVQGNYTPPPPDPLVHKITREILIHLGPVKNQTSFKGCTPLLDQSLHREVRTVPLFKIIQEVPTGVRTRKSARAVTIYATLEEATLLPLQGSKISEFTVRVKVSILREPGSELVLITQGETTVIEPFKDNEKLNEPYYRDALDRALRIAFRDLLRFVASM